VRHVFLAFGEKQLKCGFIQSKKEYVLVVGKKMVNGAGLEKYNII
jgi:hypothetical protein